jgi:YbbR domain-containing protein
MKAVLHWVRAALFENLPWKILSLFIAVLLWALVASEPEMATFFNVRVQFKNLPEDLDFSSEPAVMVSLELRGPSGELSDGSVRPAVIVDLSGVQPGEKSFPVGSSNVVLPRGVRLERAIPADVRFHFERRAPRSVKVEPRFTGEGEGGYILAHWSVEPEELIILGPASRVAGIGKVSTDPVDLTGVVGAAEFHVNAFVEDSFVRFKSSPRVTVAVTMKKK